MSSEIRGDHSLWHVPSVIQGGKNGAGRHLVREMSQWQRPPALTLDQGTTTAFAFLSVLPSDGYD